jgi:bifunctional DNA primase/polymerase-like protein
LSTPLTAAEKRDRRNRSRALWQLYTEAARAAGFNPGEILTLKAISERIREYGTEPGTPCRVSLQNIGRGLSGRSDDPKRCGEKGARACSHLFNEANPRTGYSAITRYKAPEQSTTPHAYVDNLLEACDAFVDDLEAELSKIRTSRKLSAEDKRTLETETRDKYAQDILALLPRVGSKVVTSENELYGYFSVDQAQALIAEYPEYAMQEFTYQENIENRKKRQSKFYPTTAIERYQRMHEKMVEEFIELAAASAGYPQAIAWYTENIEPVGRRKAQEIVNSRQTRLLAQLHETRHRVEELRANDRKIETLDEYYANELGRGSEGYILSPNRDCSETDNLADSCQDSNNSPQKSPDLPVATTLILRVASEINSLQENDLHDTEITLMNFQDSLESALFFARDGWKVIPICNYCPETGQCTHQHIKSHRKAKCTGKKPIVKGTGKPGEGYTAATTDLEQIRKWYHRNPDAGVGLRLDRRILIDADIKDNGPESYEYLRDTFDLPETLTAITQSGGGHYVFNLPEGIDESYLGSWTRICDGVGLPGIDIKVGKRGLQYAEPTRGSKGVYRWVDPTAEVASLPIACVEFLKSLHDEPKLSTDNQHVNGAAAALHSATPREFVYNPWQYRLDTQKQYFRDVPQGHDRHKQVMRIGVGTWRTTTATPEQLIEVMRAQDQFFTVPLNDDDYINRTATYIMATNLRKGYVYAGK